MPKFRKKPVVIEAMRFDGGKASCHSICDWADSYHDAPSMYFNDGTMIVETLEGAMRAEPGDWIIKGVKGEFYPCKPDIFQATYEPVE